MAIIKTDNTTQITCDKCGCQSFATPENYNEVFYEEGWSLNSTARKYVHKCRGCQTKKQRAAFDFVKEKFNL